MVNRTRRIGWAVLGLCLVGCGPLLEERASLIPPCDPAQQRCTEPCFINQQRCVSACTAQKNACENDAQQNEILGSVVDAALGWDDDKDRDRYQPPRGYPECDPDDCLKSCTQTLHACYQYCGGSVVYSQYCTFNCGDAPANTRTEPPAFVTGKCIAPPRPAR